MSNIERAKQLLITGNYTCVLCKEQTVYTSTKNGISPILDFIDSKTDLNNFSAADKIVGKAAAMLFIIAGVSEIYAEVMSNSAVEILKKYNIAFSYKVLTDKIINRKGNGICPMEETVAEINNMSAALYAIRQKREQLKKEL